MVAEVEMLTHVSDLSAICLPRLVCFQAPTTSLPNLVFFPYFVSYTSVSSLPISSSLPLVFISPFCHHSLDSILARRPGTNPLKRCMGLGSNNLTVDLLSSLFYILLLFIFSFLYLFLSFAFCCFGQISVAIMKPTRQLMGSNSAQSHLLFLAPPFSPWTD